MEIKAFVEVSRMQTLLAPGMMQLGINSDIPSLINVKSVFPSS